MNDGQFYHIKNTDRLDKRRSNYFSFKETISSGYIDYKRTQGKWSWQAGLRVEHTANKSDTSGRSYTNLFPAISVGYKPRDAHNFSIAFAINLVYRLLELTKLGNFCNSKSGCFNY